MKSAKHLGAVLTSALLVAMSVPTAQAKSDSVLFSSTPPVIDGVANDAAWKGGDWHDMTSLMWGSAPESGDFSGQPNLIIKGGGLIKVDLQSGPGRINKAVEIAKTP